MLYSKLFGKTIKETSSQYEARSHELLTRAGFIDQVASGIYNLLPLGRKVLTKIENIIRQEMETIGAQEITMPLLHPKNLWQKTNRWQTVEVLFKTKSRFAQEYALAPTHEETVVPLAKKWIKSYKDLPLALYHITEKFRDEPRPKSGILRGREFGMKDLYSFHETHQDFLDYYQQVIKAYLRIFKRCGLTDIKITAASGGSFTKKNSHEFNVLTSAGEVNLYYCDSCSFGQNKEIGQLKIGERCQKCQKGKILSSKGIEVGNIFDLGTRFTEAFDLTVTDKEGKKKFPVMGCYGIGTTRLLGAIVEIHNDEKGIIWPKEVSPYQVHLIGLNLKEKKVNSYCNTIYHQLLNQGIEVLFDDRKDISAGEKFVTADLIGIPIRLVISQKTGEKIEWKQRNESKKIILTKTEVINQARQQIFLI